MPGCMMSHGFWEREALLLWQQGRAPIVAAGVAFSLWLAGRLLPPARLAAAGLALVAGWWLAAGGLTFSPHLPAERLPVLAVAALAAGLAVDMSGRAAGLAGFGLAAAGGWWLAGAPRSDAAAGLVLPQMACLGLGVLLALRLLRGAGDGWPVVTAALALWGALAATGVPPLWTGLALVLLAATLGQVAAPRVAGVRLPMAAGLAGLAGLTVLVLGRFGRGGFSRVDLAVLAPVLAIWLLPWLETRLGARVAVTGAAALAVGVVWAAGRLWLKG